MKNIEILKVLQLCKDEQRRIIIENYINDTPEYCQGMIEAYRKIEFEIQRHCSNLKQFEKQAEKIWRKQTNDND